MHNTLARTNGMLRSERANGLPILDPLPPQGVLHTGCRMMYSFSTYETVFKLELNLIDIHKDTLLVSSNQANDEAERS